MSLLNIADRILDAVVLIPIVIYGGGTGMMVGCAYIIFQVSYCLVNGRFAFLR